MNSFNPMGKAIGGLEKNIPLVGGQMGKAHEMEENFLYHENKPFYVNPGEKPTYGGYTSIREQGGLLTGDLRANYGDTTASQIDQRGLNAFRDRALAAPGTSAWEQMANSKQALEEQALKQRTMESGASRAAEARSALARKGGLSSGASERMARASMRDILSQQQDAARQGSAQRADIGLQAENQRLAALSQIPGMEIQAWQPKFQEKQAMLGVQQFNIGNALQQKQAEEAAKMAEYQEKMKAWAAANQANAIGASGPKAGGLLGKFGG